MKPADVEIKQMFLRNKELYFFRGFVLATLPNYAIQIQQNKISDIYISSEYVYLYRARSDYTVFRYKRL